MKSTVEERIVEMRFDNKQFEQGAKQTMSTLDKLKEKLSFNNDAKGIEKIQNSVNKLDFSVVTKGLDNFQVRLSGLQVFANRIIENIADGVYGAVQKVTHALTGVFRQIDEGGARRAQNIEQAKFQLEGLGIAWDDIKGDIDYAVSGTAYGLDVAAKAASQLVASNVQLGDEMKFALRGISGLAAMTNSTYEDIADIFTKVAGQGRMMGEDLNRIAARGINAAAELAKAFNTTEAEIRDMVSKGKIDFLTFAKVMDDAFGEHAKDANKTYAGSLSNVNAALSRIGADIKAGHFETLRKVFVDLIPKLNEFKKAFKPVEELIIETEAAVGELIQKIISMIDVTKKVNRLVPTAKKIATTIRDAVKVVSLALGEVEKIEKEVKTFSYISREAAMSMSGFGDAVKYTSKETEKSIELTEDMQKAFEAAQEIWNTGKYGNGQARIDALEAAGIDSKKTQAIIEEFIRNGNNWDEAIKTVSEDTGEAVDENVEKAEKLKKHVKTLATIFTNIKRVITNVAVSVGNVLKVLFSVITGNLEKLHIGDILIKVTGAIANLSDKLVITEEKAEKLRHPLEVIVSIFKLIIDIVIGAGKFIVRAIGGIIKFATLLTDKIRELTGTGEGVSLIAEAFKYAKNKVTEFVDSIKNSERVKKFFEDIGIIAASVIGFITGAVTVAVDALTTLITKVKAIASTAYTFLKPFIDILKNTVKAITGVIRYIFTRIKEGTLFDDLKAKIAELTDKGGGAKVAGGILLNVIGWVEEFFSTIANAIKSLSLTDIIQILKDSAMIYALAKVVIMIKAINKLTFEIPKLLGNVSKMIASTAKVNKSISRLNNANAFYAIMKSVLTFSIAIGVIIGSIITVADYIKQGEQAKAAFQEAVKTVTDLILAIGVIIGAIVTLTKLIDLASAVFTSKSKLHIPFFLQMGVFIYSIGSTIKNVIRAIITLGNMDSDLLQTGMERLQVILVNVGAYVAILFAVLGIITKLTGIKDLPTMFIQMSVLIMAIAGAITLMVIPIAAIAGLQKILGEETIDTAVDMIKDILKAITAMISMILVLGAIFTVSNNLTQSGHSQDLAKMFLDIGIMFLAISIAMNFLMTSLASLTLQYALNPEATIAALGSMVTLIWSIIGVVGVIGKSTSSRFTSALWGTVAVIASLGVLVRFMQGLAKSIKDEYQFATVAVAFLGLDLMINAMATLMKAIGKTKPDRASITNLAKVFASLAVILIPLMFFQDKTAFDALAIAAAMAGLSAIVVAMSTVIRAIGETKPDMSKIAMISLTFASLAALLFALQWLKAEDWPAYLTALGGLALVVWAMSAAIGAIAETTTGAQIILVGASIALVTAAMAGLVAVLTWASNAVNTEKLVEIVTSTLLLATAIGALVVVASKIGGLKLIGLVLSFAGSFAIMSLGIMGVCGAIGYLIGLFPTFENALYRFVYFIGQIPRILVGSLLGKTKEELGIASPSTAFEEIGMYCIEGLFVGLLGTLKNGIRTLTDGIKNYIINPIKKVLGINSPSVVGETIGNFLGQGFQNGFTESISNFDLSDVSNLGSSITEALPDSTSIGETFGFDLKSGIIDGLSFDDFEGFEGFDTTSLTDKFDFSSFSGNMSEAIGDSVVEGVKTIDPTTLSYAIEDLANNPELYNTLKEAFGSTGVVAAYDAMKEHEEFLAENPTLDAYIENLKKHYPEKMANAYQEILANGSKEDKEGLEAFLAKEYMDKVKLDESVYHYSREFMNSVNKYMGKDAMKEYVNDWNKDADVNIADAVMKMQWNKYTPSTTNANVVMHVQDEDGNTIKGVQSLFGDGGTSSIDLNLDNTTLSNNLNSVSGDISTVINAQGDKLGQKLENLKTSVSSFNTSQETRTNNIISRISQMESAINNIKLQLDTGALVGQLVVPIDNALGERSKRKARG